MPAASGASHTFHSAEHKTAQLRTSSPATPLGPSAREGPVRRASVRDSCDSALHLFDGLPEHSGAGPAGAVTGEAPAPGPPLGMKASRSGR